MTSDHAAPEFDAALIARYDVAGPRYTSYPTAPQFRTDFREPELRAAIAASNATAAPLSLYVHVPFCNSPCFYCGCNRIITRDVARADHYLERLDREIALMASRVDTRRPVIQLHFGGGTPNFLDPQRMGALMERLSSHFAFEHEGRREFGIEIDPRFADADYIRALGDMGFNRISVGIQDFDPAVQAAVNRIQSVETTQAVTDAARGAGFSSINVDLIYGLPLQTPAGFARTLQQVIDLAPDRVAVYGYAHMPHLFKAQKQIHAGDLPNAETRLTLLRLAIEMLDAAGFVYIGMDHFARAGDELVRAQRAGTLQRNFQGYSTHGECDILGLGVSAISRIGNTYSQNQRDLLAYYRKLENDALPVARGIALNRDDVVRRAAIETVMCHGRIDTALFEARHGLVFADYFADTLEALQPLADDGLLTLDPQAVEVTPRGRLMLRNIAMCFDAYLQARRDGPRYSRVI